MDPSVQSDIKNWPFKVVDSGGNIKIELQRKAETVLFAPEEISAMILAYLKRTAENLLGRSVTKAVITVPASFNDSQRQATKDAGEIAGLQVLRIINEPTAAALAYGLDKSSDIQNILVFDFGGGTCDISILTISEGLFEVKATKGDLHLGGEDIDYRLLQHCVQEFNNWTGKKLVSKHLIIKVKRACEQAKRILSTASHAEISLEAFYNNETFKVSITRAKFEELSADLFNKALGLVRQVLVDAKMEKGKIHEVVLAGGSSRIPKIRRMLQDFFGGKKLNETIDPDEAIAYGAARHAAKLGGDPAESVQGICLIDVIPLSLGIKTEGGVMNKIIDSNTLLPTRNFQTFSTIKDNQKAASIEIFEGERSMADDNHLIGNFILEGITPQKRGLPQITIEIEVDTNGITNVTAVEEDSSSTNNLIITRNSGRLSRDEINHMKSQALRYQAEDKEMLQIVKGKLALRNYCDAIRALVESEEFHNKILDHEKKKVLNECDTLLIWLSDPIGRQAGDCEERHLEAENVISPIFARSRERGEVSGFVMQEVD